MEKPEEKLDDGKLDDAAADRYLAFLAGGLFGVFMSFAIPALIGFVIELLELSVKAS